jgi:hypothetical protein
MFGPCPYRAPPGGTDFFFVLTSALPNLGSHVINGDKLLGWKLQQSCVCPFKPPIRPKRNRLWRFTRFDFTYFLVAMPDPIAILAPTSSSAPWSKSAVNGVSVMVTVLMTMYYWCILVNLEVPTDTHAHISLLVQYCSTGLALPANCGFYFAIYLLSGLSCDQNLLLKVAVPILGLSWGATVQRLSQFYLANGITLHGSRFWHWSTAVTKQNTEYALGCDYGYSTRH